VGALVLQPHVLERALYATGIQVSPGTNVNTFLNQVSPGLNVDLGSHVSVDYTPTWTVYSNHELRNTLDHAASFTAGAATETWTLSLSQNYSISTAPLVETGNQRGRKYTRRCSAHTIGSTANTCWN